MRFRCALYVSLAIGAVSAMAIAQSNPNQSPDQFPLDGHQVVRVTVQSTNQLDTIVGLTGDVWSESAGIGTFDVRIGPGDQAVLDKLGVPYEVLIPDVQAALDDFEMLNEQARMNRDDTWYVAYHTYAEMVARLNTLAAAHPDIAQVSVVGQSIQGQDITMIRITGPGWTQDRPAVLYDGCQHAREWISPMTVMYFAERLLENYDTDPEIRGLVDGVEFLIVPVVNPDGYDYTWSTYRLWRKNRRDNPGSCEGVDLNRNYPISWGGSGSSGDMCSDVYHGTSPFSEPETAAMNALADAHPNLAAHVDVHSYSQLVLWPYGGQAAEPPEPDRTTFRTLGQDIANLIYAVHGKSYTPMASYQLYIAGGDMTDWAYDEQGLISFTIELRDTGSYGFLLPPDQIIPTGEEIFPALKHLATWAGMLLIYDFPDGLPEVVTADMPTAFGVDIIDGRGTLDGSTPRIYTRIDGGPYTETALSPLGGDSYMATLPAAACGSVIEYYISADTTGGETVSYPASGDGDPLSATATQVTVTYDDEMETDLGWTVGAAGDTATTGIWNRMDPEPTDAQPGDDHTPTGTMCWVTDGRGGSLGDYDVDGGATTLTSPIFDATGDGSGEAYVSYWRWYSNDQGADPNNDEMPVSISNNGGSSWTQLELVTENAHAWVYKSFRVADFVTPTDQMRLRFVASDLNAGSIVEAAVDDMRVEVRGCPDTCGPDWNGDTSLDSQDFIAFLNDFTAGNADYNGDTATDSQDFIAFLNDFVAGC